MTKAIAAKVKLPLILANVPGEIIDIDARPHVQKDGKVLIVNAMARPISPFDAKIMKLAATDKVKHVSAATVEDLTHIASCNECNCEIRASAEISQLLTEKDFHCIVCGESVTGNKIDPQAILAKLNIELAGDDEDEEPADEDDTSEDEEEERDDDDEDAAETDDEKKEAKASADAPVLESSQETENMTTKPATTTANTEEVKTLAAEIVADPAAAAPAVTTEQPAAPAAAVVANDAATLETKPADAAPATVETPAVTTEEKPAATVANAETPAAAVTEKPADATVETPAVTTEQPVVANAPAAETVETTEKPAAETVTEQPATVPLEVALSSFVNWKTAKVDLVKANFDVSAAYYVFANGKPVAHLKQTAAAEDLQGFFTSEAFVKAFLVAAQNGLSVEDEKRFGMEPIKTEVTVDEVVTKELEQAKLRVASEVEQEVALYKGNLLQSVNIATVGLVKGLWDTKNPLRAGLIDALAKINVVNPDRIVDAALMKDGAEFFRSVMSKADELSAASDDSRNAIGKVVATASYRNGSEGKAIDLSESLARVGTPVFELAGTNTDKDHTTTAGVTELPNKGEGRVSFLRDKFKLSQRRG